MTEWKKLILGWPLMIECKHYGILIVALVSGDWAFVSIIKRDSRMSFLNFLGIYHTARFWRCFSFIVPSGAWGNQMVLRICILALTSPEFYMLAFLSLNLDLRVCLGARSLPLDLLCSITKILLPANLLLTIKTAIMAKLWLY